MHKGILLGSVEDQQTTAQKPKASFNLLKICTKNVTMETTN